MRELSRGTDLSLRIALAQIDTVVGDIVGNVDRCLLEIERSAGADLLLFPELALVGYPPRDLLERRGFTTMAEAELGRLAAAIPADLAVVVGSVDWPDGSPLPRNLAVLLHGGQRHQIAKRLLPTYDVFDERRYFAPSDGDQLAVFQIAGVRVGISICEDMWNDAELWGARRRYPDDPIRDLAASGAQVVVNISASPFSIGKPALRAHLVMHAARRHQVGLVMCNLVGGNDSLVFDGTSLVANPDGVLVGAAASFREDHLVASWAAGTGFHGLRAEATSRAAALARLPLQLDPRPCHVDVAANTLDDLESALCLGLHDYVSKLGFSRVVLGLSGGIDSALVAYLAARVLGGDRVFALEMPSRHTSRLSRDIAAALSDRLGLAREVLAIDPVQESYLRQLAAVLGDEPGVAEENLQARIRGNYLMAVSNRRGHLVLSTGNKSEMAVGYCTLYGDMSGGLAVISDVFKLQVQALCRRINERAGQQLIPRAVIERAPSAELRPNQSDQDVLPPYELLDPILAGILEDQLEDEDIAARTGYALALVRRVRAMVDGAEFKRQQAAPTLRVSRRSWHGRRYPIVNRFCRLHGKP